MTQNSEFFLKLIIVGESFLLHLAQQKPTIYGSVAIPLSGFAVGKSVGARWKCTPSSSEMVEIENFN